MRSKMIKTFEEKMDEEFYEFSGCISDNLDKSMFLAYAKDQIEEGEGFPIDILIEFGEPTDLNAAWLHALNYISYSKIYTDLNK